MTAKIYPFPKLHRAQLRALLSGHGDPALEGGLPGCKQAEPETPEAHPSGAAVPKADRSPDPGEER